jgi:hypothetical protein
VSTHDLSASPIGLGRRIWLVAVGPVVWSAHLLVAYFGGALLCRSDHHGLGWFGRLTSGRTFIIVVTVVAAVLLIAAIATSLVRRRRAEAAGDEAGDVAGLRVGSGPFVDALAIGVNAFSLAAVLLEGFWAAGMRC